MPSPSSACGNAPVSSSAPARQLEPASQATRAALREVRSAASAARPRPRASPRSCASSRERATWPWRRASSSRLAARLLGAVVLLCFVLGHRSRLRPRAPSSASRASSCEESRASSALKCPRFNSSTTKSEQQAGRQADREQIQRRRRAAHDAERDVRDEQRSRGRQRDLHARRRTSGRPSSTSMPQRRRVREPAPDRQQRRSCRRASRIVARWPPSARKISVPRIKKNWLITGTDTPRCGSIIVAKPRPMLIAMVCPP